MHYSNKNNLLIVLWIPYFALVCTSIIFIYTHPSDNIYSNIQGSVYTSPPFKIYNKYTGLDMLLNSYCNLNNADKSKSILIEPNDIQADCFSDSIIFSNIDIFICCVLVLCFIGICVLTCRSIYLDYFNKDYGKIILLIYAVNCLIAYILLYILRFQPFLSKYFIIPHINPGIMIGYNGVHPVDSCQFGYTGEFKKCYCNLINSTSELSYLNVTNSGICKSVPNGYLFGLIIFGTGILSAVILYYLSHNQPEYEVENETIFFTKDDF